MRTLVAALLAGVALSASAQTATPNAAPNADVPLDRDVVVNSPAQCPHGTIDGGPSYHFQNGHLVRDGWVCQSLYRKH